MYKKIPGNVEFSISLSKELVRNDGGACTLPIVENKVRISIYGKELWLDLEWLSLYAHFETELPLEFRNRLLEIHFQKTYSGLTKSPSGKMMVFKRPMLIQKKYRIIPGFTRYAISCSGEMLDTKTWTLVNPPKIVEKQYPQISCYNPDKSARHPVSIHRLVGLAWIQNFCYETKPLINHIDGNKTNFHYRNLEWVSYQENSIHAVNNGLKIGNFKCKIRNVHTEVINEFDSVRQACEFMGIDPTTKLSCLIHKTKHRLIAQSFEFKRKDDDSPWFYEKYLLGTVSGRYILHLTYPDGKVEEHPDVRTFKKQFGVWNVNRIETIVSRFKQLYPEITITYTDNYKLGTIQAYNVKTNEILEAESIRKMTKMIPLNFRAINHSLIHGEKRITQGYAFRYKTDKPWDTNFAKSKCSSWCITATNRSTNEVKSFNSLREASMFFMKDRSSIRSCLKQNKPCGNWLLREYTD